jgi:hypothetical protein
MLEDHTTSAVRALFITFTVTNCTWMQWISVTKSSNDNLKNVLPNWMLHSRSWKANSASSSQKIVRYLRNLKDHYSSQKPTSAPYPERHESNTYPPIIFFKINFNIIIPSTLAAAYVYYIRSLSVWLCLFLCMYVCVCVCVCMYTSSALGLI